MVIAKLRVSAQQTKKPTPNITSKLNVEAFQNESTKHLYENRLSEKLKNIKPLIIDSPDLLWEKIQECIVKAAEETLGMGSRHKCLQKKKSTPWFTPQIKELTHEKRKAYLKYISKPTTEQRLEYREVRNRVNSRIREIKEGYWESFTADMEHDIYGAQKKVWKLIRRTKKEVNELVTYSKSTIDEWENFFRKLYRGTSDDLEPMFAISEDIPLSKEDIEKELRLLKNRKSPGPNGISNEMLKYGGTELIIHLTQLFQQIVKLGDIPKTWKESIIISLFKKGSKTNPESYRGITLLNTTLKLFTRVILRKLLKYIQPREEQQGFRKNRSTTDAIFIMCQILKNPLSLTTQHICALWTSQKLLTGWQML